jgi:hypothetical protein
MQSKIGPHAERARFDTDSGTCGILPRRLAPDAGFAQFSHCGCVIAPITTPPLPLHLVVAVVIVVTSVLLLPPPLSGTPWSFRALLY